MMGLSAWFLCGLLVVGDPEVLKRGATELSQVDDDFAYQGEYSGQITWHRYGQPVGLQVVAQGEGKFTALLYPGGLPGEGYFGGYKESLSGQRDGSRLHLTAPDLQVLIDANATVTVLDSCARSRGCLQKRTRISPTMGATPPSNAVVLFDGQNTSALKNAKVSEAGLLQIGAETVDAYEDFTLHGEFKTPYMPAAKGQARGNSGFYLQKRYEVQVLDSFGLEPQPNDAASLYKFKAPDFNMCFPPLSWQTYDIHFTAARFNDKGEKIAKARITVRHNGVVVHNNLALENKTGGGSQEGPNPMPILWQNHGNPVEYRNLWLVKTTPSESVGTPVLTTSTTCPTVWTVPVRSKRVKCR